MTGNQIIFDVRSADRIDVTGFGGSDCRAECAAEILTDLVRSAPEHFVGRKGGVWFCDRPPDKQWTSRFDLAFTSTKYVGEPAPCLPFPCPMFLRWPQVGIPNSEVLMNELLEGETAFADDRMFWIGADTHPSRRELARLGGLHPGLLDAEIMEWDRKAAGGQRSKTRQVSIPEHRRYKYLIDCPGYGYSARTKWLLASGRPLFIVERRTVEHWHEDMEPWVHFVPVAGDLSDLFENRNRLENDPELAARIAINAKRFATEHLSVEARLHHVLDEMDSASQRERPASRPHATPDDPSTKHGGNAHAPHPRMAEYEALLKSFLLSDEEWFWHTDGRVWFDGELADFKNSFEGVEAHLLATELRQHRDDPKWERWASLNVPSGKPPVESLVAAFLPLFRISRRGAEAVIDGIGKGWTGHPEVLIPTLVTRASLKVEDIGGSGKFTPPERTGRWYGPETWHWRGPVEHVRNQLHFPCPRQTGTFSRWRIAGSGPGQPSARHEAPEETISNDRAASLLKAGASIRPPLRLLYVSPVGGAARTLLAKAVECFQKAGADCWLIQYDDADMQVPQGARLIRDTGYKFPLALRHLPPDAVAEYDFIFFWDDDLDVGDFDARKFADIMVTNRLEMAQPAILSPHFISHQITRFRPCPPPLRNIEGRPVYPVVGRMTNFVEIMAPVYSREAWREFHEYIYHDNHSGWGYDYIPLGRKGIVDLMPVTHTRAVQSFTSRSEEEISRFLDGQGLFRFAPTEMGWLFDRAHRDEPGHHPD